MNNALKKRTTRPCSFFLTSMLFSKCFWLCKSFRTANRILDQTENFEVNVKTLHTNFNHAIDFSVSHWLIENDFELLKCR